MKQLLIALACSMTIGVSGQTTDVTKFVESGILDPSIRIKDGGNPVISLSGSELDISAQNHHFSYLRDDRLSDQSVFIFSVKITVPPSQGGANDVEVSITYKDQNGNLDGIRYNLLGQAAGVTDLHVRIVKGSKNANDFRVYANEVDVTHQAVAPDDLSAFLGADANQGIYLIFGNPPATKQVIWKEATYLLLND